MLQPSVQCFRGSIASAGPVEVGQHVRGAGVQGPTQAPQLDQGDRDALTKSLDHRDHRFSGMGPVGVAVGGDHPLIDAPGGLDLDVVIAGEQGDEACPLPVGQELLARDSTSRSPWSISAFHILANEAGEGCSSAVGGRRREAHSGLRLWPRRPRARRVALCRTAVTISLPRRTRWNRSATRTRSGGRRRRP